MRLRWFHGYGITNRAQTFNRYFDNVAILEKQWRIAKYANAHRSSSRDNVACFEGDELCYVLYKLGHTKNEIVRVRILDGLTIDLRGDAEPVGISHFITRGKPRSGRTEGVAGLSTGPLLVAELPFAGGDIVEDHVSGDAIESASLP